MRTTGRQALPLAPLLHAYACAGPPSIAALHRLPGLGERFAAVLAASARFLCPDFLTTAPDDRLRDALVRFYDQAVSPPLHAAELARRAGLVRHGIVQLLHGEGPVEARLAACLAPDGAYRVPGLGPAFWSAVLQGAAPARHPGWTAHTRAGAARLGHGTLGAAPAAVYAALRAAHTAIRAARPEMTALHIDHFLSLLSVMPGRGLLDGAPALAACPVAAALARLRAARPLRDRIKRQGEAVAAAQRALGAALEAGDAAATAAALADSGPLPSPEVLLPLAREWWAADDPYPAVARWCGQGGGPGLPAAVLHRRDPQRFFPFSDPHRQGLTILDDGLDPGDPPAERYRLFNEACAWLRAKHGLHPLELPDLLAALAEPDEPPRGGFGGLCPDTFEFLAELARDNSRAWMDRQRGRYHFAVRAPLAELCEALTARYVEPVLRRTHGWDIDTTSRSGRALTSIVKNAYGRGGTYNSALWVTFCPRAEGRAGPQLFVRVAADGLRYGLRLGGAAVAARQRLREAVAAHADGLFRRLTDNGALQTCRFGLADQPGALRPVTGPDDLRAVAAGRSLEASLRRPPADASLPGDELLGDIVLTFDRLLPLFAAAVEGGASATLPRLGAAGPVGGYGEANFCKDTFLGPQWLRRALDLLALKRQVILQGPPGTGKTHVARALARLLTGGRDDAVRLVQFHPAYSYEEFVEGIKVRSVPVEGRHEVTYPVEDGLLCSFAARAAAHPAQPHVLVIDEVNRGNLPRIFGELLFLLEYREQAVVLPYSRRSFALPANLHLVATMNAADRSVAPIDQALRRRFSFVDMEPDAEVLAAALRGCAPAMEARAVGVFERLNARLRAEAGAAQVGHSYFLQATDEARLRVIWRHHVRPLLDDIFAGQPGRAAAYDALLEEPARGRAKQATPF